MENKVWSIGRKDAKECDILLNGETISSVHASLNFLNGKFYLIDNKSKNGSYLIRNNKKIVLTKHTEVLPIDTVVFGVSKFAFDDLILLSSQSKGNAVTALTIMPEHKKSISKPQSAQILQKTSNKKIRCMECMEPIFSNAICPSCKSDKHLKGEE